MDQPRERRIPVKAPVSFEGRDGVGRGTTFNLSAGGCALESRAGVNMDATIKLDLHLPNGGKPVRVGKAKIIWTAGSDFGVEFVNMNDTGRARLRGYIESLQKNDPTQDRA
jgi:hypothetical protein